MKNKFLFFLFGFLIVICSIQTLYAAKLYAVNFGVGDVVKVYNTGVSGLVVRDPNNACGTQVGGKFDGDLGIVLSGPYSCSSYNRWKVRWSDGLEGWSAEGYPGGLNYLTKVSITPSTKFNIGDKIKINANGVNVRNDPPELSDIGNVNNGDTGSIVANSFYGIPKSSSGFYYFWKIDFDTKTDGWIAEIFLDKDSCTNECSSGQARCYGYYKQTCGNYDADSCTEWGGDFSCLNGCAYGECIGCVPKTCSQLGKQCGGWDNGCSQSIDCGICTSGTCDANGQCVSNNCDPSVFPELFKYSTQKNQDLYDAFSMISQELKIQSIVLTPELLSAIMTTLEKEVGGNSFLPVEENGDYGMGPGCTYKIGGVCRSTPYDGYVSGDGRGGIDYKGRGYIQITHKYNYADYCGSDCVGTSTPELNVCGCKNQYHCTITDENICPQIKALQPTKAGKIFVLYYKNKYYSGKNLITYSNEKNYWWVGYLINGGSSYADDFKVKADNYFNLFNTQQTKTNNLIACLSKTSPTCTSGQTKCEGNNYYECQSSAWANKGIVNGKCGVECLQKSGCGSDGYVESKYCVGNSVKQKYRTYSCSSYKCSYTETENNIENCGTANYCSGTSCLTCSSGYANCDGNEGNGCEINKNNDNNNCGSCGNVCGTGTSCQIGVCISTCTNECYSGEKRCNGNYKQTCGNYDADSCLEFGGDSYCSYGCTSGNCNTCVSKTFYKDNDRDGYGNLTKTIQSCSVPGGYASNSLDCNDNNRYFKPGAVEICDRRDNDCDGQIDEGVSKTFYKDNDRDGYGNLTKTIQSCSVPGGYASNSLDCNDNNRYFKPGAVEICNDRRDNDCDGKIDASDSDCTSCPSSVCGGYCGSQTGSSTFRFYNPTSGSGYYFYCTDKTCGYANYEYCPNGCTNGVCNA